MASISAEKSPAPMNKKDRAKLAKETINTLIPHILKTTERARNGVNASQLIRYDPLLVPKPSRSPRVAASASAQVSSEGTAAPIQAPLSTPLKIRVLKSDTFSAAHAISLSSPPRPKRRIAVLNMASPQQPGGGVLSGAMAQEESLCMRSTLYASLREEWYRIPEDAVGWSPDVCVFRSSDDLERELAKKDWWYVDVVSCAALKYPQTVDGEGNGEGSDRMYANEGQRNAMAMRVRTILQVATMKGVTHLVLGALGCGAYRNPPQEVARIFKKVICGDRRRKGLSVEESGIEEIVFAIFDEGVNLRTFREVFADVAVAAGNESEGPDGVGTMVGITAGKEES